MRVELPAAKRIRAMEGGEGMRGEILPQMKTDGHRSFRKKSEERIAH
jgi:hypothetical protein